MKYIIYQNDLSTYIFVDFSASALGGDLISRDYSLNKYIFKKKWEAESKCTVDTKK